MSLITPGCPLCDARIPHGACQPPTQVIQPPSIVVVAEDPDWTPEACASEEELRQAIVKAIRRKLHASNDLRDLRAREAEVQFEYNHAPERWDPERQRRAAIRVECLVSIVWRLDADHRAAAIGRAELQPMVPPWQTWWDAARGALRKLGV